MILRRCWYVLLLAAAAPVLQGQGCACLGALPAISENRLAQIELARSRNDMPQMRQFAWEILQGLVRPGSCDPTIPIMLTWYSRDDAFGAAACPSGTSAEPPLKLKLFLNARGVDSSGSAPDFHELTQESVLFNQPLVDHLRASFQFTASTPPLPYHMNNRQELCAVGHLVASKTFPYDKTQVPDFPGFDKKPPAVALKLLWLIARKGTWTPLPIWDPEFNPADPNEGNYPRRFLRWAAVNPDVVHQPRPETLQLSMLDETRNATKVGMDRFFSILVTAKNVQALSALVKVKPQPGDRLVLVSAHVAAKVLQDWLWMTFWWHDRPDLGFGADRPSQIGGGWQNYRMNISYDMDLPREFDGSPHTCFNPYLEASISPNLARENGLSSNCMSCHRMALTPKLDASTVTRGRVGIEHPLLVFHFRLDYLWSIALRASCNP